QMRHVGERVDVVLGNHAGGAGGQFAVVVGEHLDRARVHARFPHLVLGSVKAHGAYRTALSTCSRIDARRSSARSRAVCPSRRTSNTERPRTSRESTWPNSLAPSTSS